MKKATVEIKVVRKYTRSFVVPDNADRSDVMDLVTDSMDDGLFNGSWSECRHTWEDEKIEIKMEPLSKCEVCDDSNCRYSSD